MPSVQALRIDGSQGEGGGQIVRTSLVLSLALGRPFVVDRIRAGRPRPGLKAQHLSILRLLEEMSGSTVTGAALGATTVAFEPGPLRSGRFRFDVGTAGSLPLLLQTILPLAALAPGRVELLLRGGTDVPFGPTIDWVRQVYLPKLRPLARVDLDVGRRGFYPAGGGEVRLSIAGRGAMGGDLQRLVRAELGAPCLEQRGEARIEGLSFASEALREARVAERQHRSARAAFFPAGLPTPRVRDEYGETDSPGSGLTLWVEDEAGSRLGSDALGARGKRAERVGEEAANSLLADWSTGATVDRHLADHWALWVALGAGAVRVPTVTPHLATNLEVCRAFLGPQAVSLHGDILRGPS